MAVATDRRLPDCPRLTDRGVRGRGRRAAVLVVNTGAGSALLADNRAAAAPDWRRRPRHELRRLLIVSRVRSIVVVDVNIRLGAVPTLKGNVVAVRADRRCTESESATRRCDRACDAGLAIEQE